MLKCYILIFSVCLAVVNGKNAVIDNLETDENNKGITVTESSEESEEHSVKLNKPNKKRAKGNSATIPQENNFNGNYGNQKNQNLNFDFSDGGLMINGKKVKGTPGKRVKYNDENGLPSSKSNTSNFTTTYNNRNNGGNAVNNLGGVTVNYVDDGLVINGKKVPGVKANEEAVIEYGKGVLKVNGVRKKMFNGIQGSGSIVFGANYSNIKYDDDSDQDSDEDEDRWMGQGKKSRQNTKKTQYQNNNYMMDRYGNINSGNNISHIGGASYKNNFNGRKRPTMGNNGMIVGGPNGVQMGNNGMIVGGPNGVQMGNNGMTVGGPNGVQMGRNGMRVGGSNGVQMGSNGMKVGGPNGIEMGPDGIKVGRQKRKWQN